MIFKNDVRYNLTEAERKEYQKPMVWVIAPDKYYWDTTNKRWMLPRQGILTHYTQYTETEGMIEIRYADKTTQNPNNPQIRNYLPEIIELGEKGVIETQAKDYELNWYLFNTPWCISNPKRPSNAERQYSLFDRKEFFKERTNVSKRQMQALMELWDDQRPMAEDKIRAICRTLSIAGIPVQFDIVKSDIIELKTEIDRIIKASPTQYFEAIKDPAMNTRKIINQGITMGLFEYDKGRKGWNFKEEGESAVQLFTIKNNDDPSMALEKFLNREKKYLDKVVAAMSETV